MTRNLESSFMSLDANGNMIPKTHAAAVLAVATYLQVTRPPEGDPRVEKHRQAILGMGMIGAKLQTEAAPPKEASPRRNPQGQEAEITRGNREVQRHEETPPRRRDTKRRRSDDRERRRPDDRNATRDARDQITQNRVEHARAE